MVDHVDDSPGKAGPDWPGGRGAISGIARGRVRLLTLVLIRWIAVSGQLLAILWVQFGLRFDLPLTLALAAVAASALLNVAVTIRYSGATRLSNREAAYYLAYDILQLGALLFFTGGLTNPFTLLILVPVTISATVLSLRSTLWLGVLSVICITILAVFHMPLPWRGGAPTLPELYVVGIWAALVLGMIFITIYAWRVAEEARRMGDALAETQFVLAREQKMSALGGLAAAAAHELGTPLGTIALVAKEVKNQLPAGSEMAEDMTLIAEQTSRCRDILGQLSRSPEAEGRAEHFSHVSLSALVQEAVEPHRGDNIKIEIETLGEGPPPLIPRRPEILHGLGNFIENAVDFSKAKVIVRVNWQSADLIVEVIDDGAGFKSDILGRLGEPYITSRKLSDDGGGGLGLGVFIAKTLLERTGAHVEFHNQRGGGAKVGISWPRAEFV